MFCRRLCHCFVDHRQGSGRCAPDIRCGCNRASNLFGCGLFACSSLSITSLCLSLANWYAYNAM